MAAAESGLQKVQQQPSDVHRIAVDNHGAENSIYRILDYVKDGDKKAYVPQVVSLGPYHHGEKLLRPMEQHKLRCLHQILERCHHEIGLYLDSVKEVEQRARACYEGTISMSSDDFVLMMVLDGCFVIELLRGVSEGFESLGYPRNDPIFSSWGSMLKTQIKRDMILLENQIPLFVLDRLLCLQLGRPNQEGRLGKLGFQFFKPAIEIGGGWVDSRQSSDQLHCLEVLWRNLLPSDLEQNKTQEWALNRDRLIPSVTELREAGTTFEIRSHKSLGDIRFQLEDGILEIPYLVIHEGTRSLFLNLIAFEQSHFDCGNHITSYAIFMHNLISSPEDVRYLRDHEIITHCLGSDAEVVDLFKRLCQEVAFDISDSYLHRLAIDINAYCLYGFIPHMPGRGNEIIAMIYVLYFPNLARKWRSWVAILKNKYFDNPWSIISLIAAFALLVLTAAQTIYSVCGYYWPRS